MSPMKRYAKKDFPVAEIRRFLEPGPVVLVSSAWKGKTNLMTMGWHTVMEFTPSLVGCIISSSNLAGARPLHRGSEHPDRQQRDPAGAARRSRRSQESLRLSLSPGHRGGRDLLQPP